MDVSGIEVVPGERSSFAWIPVDAQGDRLIYMFPNVTARVTGAQIRLPRINAPLYDVTPDATRFIVATSVDPAAANSITLLLNWPSLLTPH